MSVIGHNRGPATNRGHSWRRHCRTEAHRTLVPTLPLEVVRLRPCRFCLLARQPHRPCGRRCARRLPAEAVLLIGDTEAERNWSVAAALAAYLPA